MNEPRTKNDPIFLPTLGTSGKVLFPLCPTCGKRASSVGRRQYYLGSHGRYYCRRDSTIWEGPVVTDRDLDILCDLIDTMRDAYAYANSCRGCGFAFDGHEVAHWDEDGESVLCTECHNEEKLAAYIDRRNE